MKVVKDLYAWLALPQRDRRLTQPHEVLLCISHIAPILCWDAWTFACIFIRPYTVCILISVGRRETEIYQTCTPHRVGCQISALHN